jgi:hypothetical protein
VPPESSRNGTAGTSMWMSEVDPNVWTAKGVD